MVTAMSIAQRITPTPTCPIVLVSTVPASHNINFLNRAGFNNVALAQMELAEPLPVLRTTFAMVLLVLSLSLRSRIAPWASGVVGVPVLSPGLPSLRVVIPTMTSLKREDSHVIETPS